MDWLQRLVFDWVGPELEESGWSFPRWAVVHSGLVALVGVGAGVRVQGTPLLKLKQRSPRLWPEESVDLGKGGRNQLYDPSCCRPYKVWLLGRQ